MIRVLIVILKIEVFMEVVCRLFFELFYYLRRIV